MSRLIVLSSIFVLLVSGIAYAEDGFKLFLGYAVDNATDKMTTYYSSTSTTGKDNTHGIANGPSLEIQYYSNNIFARGIFDYWYTSAKDEYQFGNTKRTYHHNVYNYKAEGNIGYKAYKKDNIDLTPYIGIGFLHIKSNRKETSGWIRQEWPYGVVGGIIKYEVPEWSIGLDIAALMPFFTQTEGGGTAGESYKTDIGFGGRVQVPVTYTIVQKKANAVGVMLFTTPFYEYSDSGKSSWINNGHWRIKTIREQYGMKAGIGINF